MMNLKEGDKVKATRNLGISKIVITKDYKYTILGVTHKPILGYKIMDDFGYVISYPIQYFDYTNTICMFMPLKTERMMKIKSLELW